MLIGNKEYLLNINRSYFVFSRQLKIGRPPHTLCLKNHSKIRDFFQAITKETAHFRSFRIKTVFTTLPTPCLQNNKIWAIFILQASQEQNLGPSLPALTLNPNPSHFHPRRGQYWKSNIQYECQYVFKIVKRCKLWILRYPQSKTKNKRTNVNMRLEHTKN